MATTSEISWDQIFLPTMTLKSFFALYHRIFFFTLFLNFGHSKPCIFLLVFSHKRMSHCVSCMSLTFSHLNLLCSYTRLVFIKNVIILLFIGSFLNRLTVISRTTYHHIYKLHINMLAS